jgi:MATE family multidrug resistance protein
MSLNKQILQLAVPSILANITIPLVGMVDTAIAGHLGDAVAIGGIAIGTMLFDLLYWNFGFLRVGTSGMTAQAYGREFQMSDVRCQMLDKRVECGEETSRLLKQSICTALIATMLIWAIQWVFVTGVLAVMPCSKAVAEMAREYFFVRIWAAPATLSLMAFKGWFIGMQDTKSPMTIDILVNVVNMGASYGLAVYTQLGVVGVAWGTLIAQYSGLILAVILLAAKYRMSSTQDSTSLLVGMKDFVQLNGNIFVRSLCFMVVYVGYTAIASSYGDTELAVSSILMKLFMLFSFFVDGFAYAGEALVGKIIGEAKGKSGKGKVESGKAESLRGREELERCVLLLFRWSLGVGLVFALVYALWGRNCIGLLTDDAEVLTASSRYIGWLIAMPIISTLAFMWDGIYVGATAGKEIRNGMVYAALGFAIAYAACYELVGIQALYIAYFAHLLARVVYLSAKWRTLRRNILRIC